MTTQPTNSYQAPPKAGPWSQSMMTGKQRLGYFLIGATFSCILMGFYVSYRSKVREQIRLEQEAREAHLPKPVPGVPLNPHPDKR